MTRALRIGDLAGATDTQVVTIRYYEKIGLMPAPERGAGNYRRYDRAMLDRLLFIRRCRALGFSIEEIRGLLALSNDASRPCGEIDRITGAHLREVELKIANLQRLAVELRRIAASCDGKGWVVDCRIVEALAGGATA